MGLWSMFSQTEFHMGRRHAGNVVFGQRVFHEFLEEKLIYLSPSLPPNLKELGRPGTKVLTMVGAWF